MVDKELFKPESSETQMMIKYQNIDMTLKFSRISRTSSPEKALDIFVAELLYALTAGHQLWHAFVHQGEDPGIIELLDQVIQAIRTYCQETAEFIEESLPLKEKALEHPNLVTETVQRAIGFEEKLGPLLVNLEQPLMFLAAYTELIRTPLLSEADKKEHELLFRFRRVRDHIVSRILAPYIEHPDKAISSVEIKSLVPLPPAAMVEEFIKQHFQGVIASRINALKELLELRQINVERFQEWFEEEQRQLESCKAEQILPWTYEGGFFRKHSILEITIIPGDYLAWPHLPGRHASTGLFAFDGETLYYLHGDQAQLEAIFRAEARPIHQTNAYHMAYFLTKVLLGEEGHHLILSSDLDMLTHGVGDYELNFEEMKSWLGRILSPKILGDSETGWRLEFSTLSEALLKPNTITNYHFYISPDFSITIEKIILTGNAFSRLPNIQI